MEPNDLSRILLPIQPTDHVHGPESAPHTLVEYGDYQCPDCGRLYATLRDLQEGFGSRLRIVYRQYPLSGSHPHAQKAAEAAEAAGAQGRFWEMHALLFEHQNALETKDLLRYATELPIDVERFRRELKEGVYSDRVRKDFRAGVQNGVYATPELFLDRVRHSREWDGTPPSYAASWPRNPWPAVHNVECSCARLSEAIADYPDGTQIRRSQNAFVPGPARRRDQ